MPIEPLTHPDATHDPAGYKQALLDIIESHAQEPLEVISRTTATMRDLVAGVSEEALHAEPEPGEWSAKDVVAHLFDVDIVYGFRWRLVLTWDNPTYPGYDEKLFTPLPRLPFWQMLGAWEGLRAMNVVLLEQTPRELWTREGFHGEQGGETFDEMVRKLAAHDLVHLNQAARAIEAYDAAKGPGTADVASH
ncbi:DinB family protein [Myceligenerans crystallogenes]|uniref:DinB-like domain-containing protein n=1 Tax=Myceligenerans crystallogenes TaxID=316335 RepID=A0ABP4ZHS1_9MICO